MTSTAKQAAFISSGTLTYSSELASDEESAPRGLRASVNSSLKSYRDSLDLLHSQALVAAEHAPGHRKEHDEGVAEGLYKALKLWSALFKKER